LLGVRSSQRPGRGRCVAGYAYEVSLKPQASRPQASSLLVVDILVRLAGGDVVDVRHLLFHCVDIVEAEGAAGLLHRDRTERLVIALFFLLRRAGTALRLRVGSEVSVACRRTGRAAAGVE